MRCFMPPLWFAVLVLGLFIPAHAADTPIAQEHSSLLDGHVAALCYSPYRKGQHPDRGHGEAAPTPEQILEDLHILLHDTPFRLLRVYDSGPVTKQLLQLIDQHNMPFRVMLGAWISAEVNNSGCSWCTEPYTDAQLQANKVRNAMEVQRAIHLANHYPHIVQSVSVGNEALVSWTDHLVPTESLISYVRTVKGAIEQLVTVAENYEWWATQGEQLAAELDFVSVHIYPIWEQRNIDEGLSYSIENMQRVRNALPNSTLVITEAGWATTASEFGERASQEKQAHYYHQLMKWATQHNITTFFFQAFDESWKGDPNNPLGAEKHWGLYFEDRSPKLVVKSLKANTATYQTQSPAQSSASGPVIIKTMLTSESGHKAHQVQNASFAPHAPSQTSNRTNQVFIEVFPEHTKQTIYGLGSSFTESSAFVLAHLDPHERRKVMREAFSKDGANFSLTRTHIASCDFTVEGRYTYASSHDKTLANFTIAPDAKGFDQRTYPGIKDQSYDLLPMIKEAQAIKQEQQDQQLRIMASAWTAPPWMKDIEDWFIPGASHNNHQGTGGKLKQGYEPVYASYLIKYLDAYKRAGVDIWGITPVNEPHGNSGQWESMHFTPESQRDFIKHHLGPQLRASEHHDTHLLIYDQNRDGLEEWAETILSDQQAAQYVHGIAVHWYTSTYNVFEETFQKVNAKFPAFPIFQTEGCIDDLGKEAPPGIRDPEGFQESGWFNNDSWWWNANATDWAYTAPWAKPSVEDHPMYVPVHRYARDIIVGFDNWLAGWTDWNLVLDAQGGPNHVGNFCGAPIMIDTNTGDVHYTPLFSVMKQISSTIRPGDQALLTHHSLGSLNDDALHACATLNTEGIITVQLLNTTKEPIEFTLKISEHAAQISMPANAVKTIQIQLR